MTETTTQRTGLLHTYSTEPREEDIDPQSVEHFRRHGDEARRFEFCERFYDVLSDGRSYVVEQVGVQRETFLFPLPEVRVTETYCITLRRPEDAEVGEWVHEEAIQIAKTPYYMPVEGHALVFRSLYDLHEFRHQRGIGWLRVQ